MEGRNGARPPFSTAFEGVIPNLMRRYRDTNSEYIRNKIAEFMTDRPCPTCKGNRLRQEALAVTVNDANIIEVTTWPVLQHPGMGRTSWTSRGCHFTTARKGDCRAHLQGNSRLAWVSW